MSGSGDLRTAMRQEQYKRGLLKSSKRSVSSSKPKPEGGNGTQPTEAKAVKPEADKADAASSALPQGFFDDPKAQSKVEDELKKQQELERLQEESRLAKSMAEKDLEQAQMGQVETKMAASEEEGQMDRDLEELQAFTKAIEAKATSEEELKEVSAASKDKGAPSKDTDPGINMTDDAVTATSEEMLMDKYADRMIKIVKRSLNQDTDEEEDDEEDSGLKEMESKLRQGMRRKRKLEEAEMEGFETPW